VCSASAFSYAAKSVGSDREAFGPSSGKSLTTMIVLASLQHGISRATDCLGNSVADVNVGALLGHGDRDLPYVLMATRGFLVRCDAAQLGQEAAD